MFQFSFPVCGFTQPNHVTVLWKQTIFTFLRAPVSQQWQTSSERSSSHWFLSEWLNQAAALKVWLTADARCTLISSCLRAARLNCSDGGRRVVILWITSWKFTLKTAYLHIYSFIHLFMFFFFFCCWKFHCFSSLSFSLNLLFLSC